MADGIKVGSDYRSAVVGMDYHLDAELHPIAGSLTADGVQWGTAFTTTAVGELQEAWRWAFDPYAKADYMEADLLLLEIAITLSLLASDAAVSGTWKLQYSQDGLTWTDLHTVVSESGTLSTAAVERTRQGFASIASITKTPIYIRLMVSCETAEKTVTAAVKNSSYVRGVGEVKKAAGNP